MKLLANENIPLGSIKLLREQGYDVLSIAESDFGISDEQVLKMAHDTGRIILTFDRDYGTLVYKYRQTVPLGVVYFRFFPAHPTQMADVFLNLIQNKIVLENKFTVVEADKIRQRNLQ
ncbi:MAG: DUF5615 family PIN-like protein [Flavobacteriales bacterium]